MSRFLRRNGLSLALGVLFLASYLGGQLIFGWRTHNDDRVEHRQAPLSLTAYLGSAHFVEATMENWESEFFQMFVYIYITTFLFQKGSAESNDPDQPPEKLSVTARSPWPVRKGGAWRAWYGHSLSLTFAALFLVSFWFHATSSARLESEERVRDGRPGVSVGEHLSGAKFWFESFQNWQSEFLAIGCMVVFTIFLRERNSPESKPLAAAHDETGC